MVSCQDINCICQNMTNITFITLGMSQSYHSSQMCTPCHITVHRSIHRVISQFTDLHTMSFHSSQIYTYTFMAGYGMKLLNIVIAPLTIFSHLKNKFPEYLFYKTQCSIILGKMMRNVRWLAKMKEKCDSFKVNRFIWKVVVAKLIPNRV